MRIADSDDDDDDSVTLTLTLTLTVSLTLTLTVAVTVTVTVTITLTLTVTLSVTRCAWVAYLPCSTSRAGEGTLRRSPPRATSTAAAPTLVASWALGSLQARRRRQPVAAAAAAAAAEVEAEVAAGWRRWGRRRSGCFGSLWWGS